MSNNFDLKKFLVENKLTTNSRLAEAEIINQYDEAKLENRLDEGWKSQLAGLLLMAGLVGASTKGVSIYQHKQMEKVEYALEAGKEVIITSKNAITSDTPLATDTYTLKYEPSQSDPISIDGASKTIKVNTLDMTTSKFRRTVRDAIRSTKPGGAIRKITGIHVDIKN